MNALSQSNSTSGQRYLLLADISGYTSFLAGVEEAHGVDFSGGIPAGYTVLGELLNAVIEGVQPEFEVAKLEGDAVFAIANADALDGRGEAVVRALQGMYRAFVERRFEARSARDHVCTACPVVSNLDLKAVLHRGVVVTQTVGSHRDVVGPAVNVAHRLLKNTVHARIGFRPYLFLTDVAAAGLGLPAAGLEHHEEYPDVGKIQGRVVDLVVS